jgi:xanthine dehydrogenase small subunit
LQGFNPADETTYQNAIDMLAHDYQPISDMRATSAYRLETAQALLHKSLLELAGQTSTRVIGQRTVAA